MLLKGVNKRVIIIKNPGSEIFEEAYFILKSSNIKGAFKQSSKENEMVIEANRIISDYHNQQKSVSGSAGDMAELDNFLNMKPDKNKLSETQKLTRIPEEDVFTEEKSAAGKFDFYDYNRYSEKSPRKSAFKFLASKKIKKIRIGNIPMPPKSFFVGVGFMSAVIILIRLIEVVFLR